LWVRIGLVGVVAIIVVIGAADAVSDPARASLLPDLVGQDQIRDATGLMDATGRQTWVIGPGTAAVLLAVMEPEGLFLVDADSALALATAGPQVPQVRPSGAIRNGSRGDRPGETRPRARSRRRGRGRGRVVSSRSTAPKIAVTPESAQKVWAVNDQTADESRKLCSDTAGSTFETGLRSTGRSTCPFSGTPAASR
jgi:hypothetical protein